MSTIEVAPETSTWSRPAFVPTSSTPDVSVDIETEEWIYGLIFIVSMISFFITFLKRKTK
jgi:hypothetical protein